MPAINFGSTMFLTRTSPAPVLILSLVFMSLVSTYMYQQLTDPTLGIASWVSLPFLFTIFGSTLGWMFEVLDQAHKMEVTRR